MPINLLTSLNVVADELKDGDHNEISHEVPMDFNTAKDSNRDKTMTANAS